MRFALLSDLHANMPAVSACLADIETKRVDRIAILGDLVGYGPNPSEVVALCRRLQASGAVVLRGNHDEIRSPTLEIPADNWAITKVAAWTYQQLSQTDRIWLKSLPLVATHDDYVFVHATLDDPQAWFYATDHYRIERSINSAIAIHGASVVLCGHVHEQILFYQGTGREYMRFTPRPGVAVRLRDHRAWLACVGSVGQPRDGDPRACYVILDTVRRTIQFNRVVYDIQRAVKDLRSNQLPEELVNRLEDGR
ncbi:MAG: metallophosphoesterase family protein [Burkholderiaceae bacterium]|nr:metallophosphoesterase family protein [Burkholderiaceae bacterium]